MLISQGNQEHNFRRIQNSLRNWNNSSKSKPFGTVTGPTLSLFANKNSSRLQDTFKSMLINNTAHGVAGM